MAQELITQENLDILLVEYEQTIKEIGVQFIWITGEQLQKAKEKIIEQADDGRAPGFQEWVKRKFNWNPSTARRYIKAYKEHEEDIGLIWGHKKRALAHENFDITTYIQYGKWNIVYADPPWFYENAGTRSNAHSQYPCLSLDEICEYRIKEKDNKKIHELVADNAILFLWVTDSFLQESFRVIESWGFQYKTVGFVWGKTNSDDSLFMGMGNYTRANPELCLLGTRGKLPRQDASILKLHLAKRLEHSKKPHLFRQLIKQLYGELPRVEIFATERFPGWDAIGNNITKGLFDE